MNISDSNASMESEPLNEKCNVMLTVKILRDVKSEGTENLFGNSGV